MGGDILLITAAAVVILAIGDYIWWKIQIYKFKKNKKK
tara:strand:- start:1121 stop:1234 length:114 start_codon:yes stop_codon:yes gene_type:complete